MFIARCFRLPPSPRCFLRLARLAHCGALALTSLLVTPAAAAPVYSWESGRAHASGQSLEQRIAPPDGFARAPAAPGSFAEWLRGLPLKPVGSPVLLYTGSPKARQDVHAAVIDIDVGKRDLQQCADAIMRLRGEWLYGAGRRNEIGFNYTDGKRRAFASRGRADYASFRKYMDRVFAYAGTYSLERELRPVKIPDIAIGDVFIKGGFPGHAVLVADIAENKATGEKRFLLVQSYMPAQEMHVLNNPASADGSPWYRTDFGNTLVTPEWRFTPDMLRRWP